ncbi:MAG: HAD-IA family hydrolase [Terriglobales bacterium]|jgi:phosphoglycolate phosphatase
MIRFLRRFDPHSIRLLVFDLDGTLIDSRLDLIHSINATLRHFGRPELPGDVIASYVGDGAPALVQRALGNGADEAFFKQALEYFLAYYRMHKLDHTAVYDGIPEVLAALAGSCGADTPVDSPSQSSGSLRAGSVRPGQQRLMAVLSNKPVHPSRAIVEALGMGDYFVRVYGGNSFPTKKPDPLGVRTLLEETSVTPQEALMIGDSSIDVQTGQNAGMWTCGVLYGFAPHSLEEVRPDVLVERPAELGELFG